MMDDSCLQQRLEQANSKPASVFENQQAIQADMKDNAKMLLEAFSNIGEPLRAGESLKAFPSKKCPRNSVSPYPAAARTELLAPGDKSFSSLLGGQGDFGERLLRFVVAETLFKDGLQQFMLCWPPSDSFGFEERWAFHHKLPAIGKVELFQFQEAPQLDAIVSVYLPCRYTGYTSLSSPSLAVASEAANNLAPRRLQLRLAEYLIGHGELIPEHGATTLSNGASRISLLCMPRRLCLDSLIE